MNTMRMIAVTLLMLMCVGNINAQSMASFRVQDVTVKKGQEMEIPVQVDNPLEFNGLQLSVSLPKELEFTPYEDSKGNNRIKWAKLNTARCEESHNVISGKAPKNNRLTFLACSYQNEPFIGRTGELLKFKIKVAEDAIPGVYYIHLNNMEFSDMQNKSVEQDAMTVKVTIIEESATTGLEEINASNDKDSAMYNIQGQRIKDNAKGIIINNNHKYINK